MLRLAVAQLRFRPGRSAALIVVLIATVACFALVGASAKTQQVTVHGTLEADSRAAYDLLVRPAGTVTAAERHGDLVSSTAMSSIDGGITLAQWHKIEQIPGMSAAAPVAVVGYDYLQYDVAVHLPGPAPGQSQVLYRLTPAFISENGLTKVPAEDQYVYTTTSPLADPLNEPAPDIPQRDGNMLAICQAGTGPASTSEIVPACGSTSRQDAWNTAVRREPPRHRQWRAADRDAGHRLVLPVPGRGDRPGAGSEAGRPGPRDHLGLVPGRVGRAGQLLRRQARRADQENRRLRLGVRRRQRTAGHAVPVDQRPGAGRRHQPDAGGAAGHRVPDAAVRGGHGRRRRHRRHARQALPGTAPAAKDGSMTVTAQQVYSQLLGQLAGKNLANSTEACDSGNAATGANDFETLMTASPVRYASRGAAQVPQVVPPERVVSDSEYCSRRIRRCPCRMCTRT